MILVGEVRGEEAYVLFQALATGHGGMCTMHAEDVETVIQRLTQPPMNIPLGILPLMNCVIVVKQVKATSFLACSEKKTSSRKFVRISELDGRGVVHDVFTWNPSEDVFQHDFDNSYLLSKMAKNLDVPLSVVNQELEHRKQILLNMVEKNLRDFKSVHKALCTSLNVADLDKVT